MKKKLIAGILTAALAITAAFGVSASAMAADAAIGGNISIAETADPMNINPLYVVDQTSFDMMQALYAPFFEIVKGEMYYGNGLCESVTANEDFTEVTLKLKENLKWHDGEPLTAEDVVFTMDVLVDSEQNVPYQAYGFIDGEAVQTEAIDDLTVLIKLPTSSAGFLGGLSQIYCIPKHIYEGVGNIGESELNNNPIGNGPYKFKEYRPGESFIVERFDDYFGDTPYLDTITFKIVKDSNTANASLASGDINARLISSEDYDVVNATGKVNIISYDSGRVNVMGFNQNNEPMKDARVRQAIAYALDKEELVTFAYLSSEFADPAYSILTPDTMYYDDSLTQYNNDQAKAQQLLAEAGYSNLSLTLLYTATNKTMESEAIYIQSKLAEVGISVELYPLDESTYKNKTKDREATDYDLMLSFYTLGAEPSLYGDILKSDSRSNYGNVRDEELDALWDKGNSIPNGEERENIYKEIQKITNDNMYIYPIAYSKGFYAVDKSYGGFEDVILQTIYYDYSKVYKIQ
ncbi:MAG: ABC transporter substrate-binding protein [Lachnospiraceae bacterium]|nr:ABC transporter substrate-binding protein [Robinsoniella sp.]MDY3765262.1 ABC transporter substrate-binding protein [Lachnospiraceae bacterium]